MDGDLPGMQQGEPGRLPVLWWRTLGAGLEHAYAVLGEGRCLAALGDPSAESTLREARRLFAEMGALPRVAECDTLIARVGRLSS